MRRNMGRRGGNNSGAGGPGGPLMTGHLKDIDLELELLKRKREMIEQQQQLLVMEQQFKSSRHYESYDQTRFDEPEQHGSNRDFTHLYDNGSKHRNQFGRKRQAEFQWQYEGSPKRTAPRRKNIQSPFNQHGPGNTGPANIRNQRPGPKSSPKRPAPLMDVKIKPSIGQKIANQKTPYKEFTPTKVFKPKASAAPNKTSSQTSAERKSLGSAANDSASGDVSRMLLPDQVPTLQVSGRLELALGAIMKNIRRLVPDDSPNAPFLRSMQLQRVMKQAIRERIRNVMLGKVVGSLNDILAIYREEFPEETDMDIVNLALEAGGVLVQEKEAKVKEPGDPVEYFRRNMVKLLDTSLQKMFDKLEEINKIVPSDNESSENQADQQKPSEPNNKEFEEDYKNFLENGVKAREVKKFLPRLMKKFIPYMIKCLNVDSMYQNTKAEITMKAKQIAASVADGQGITENTEVAKEASDARQARNLPYFVKIMGRPSLPKKKAMQAFLNQFNPKSIKKHRTIHNLLFVGFSEKTDFDLIVAAEGTAIGRSVLSIRVCAGKARDSSGENNESFAMDVGQEDAKRDESKDSDIITAELDGQITDLLSSIRKSEEESNETSASTGNVTYSSDDKTESCEQNQKQSAENQEEKQDENVQGDENENDAENPDNVNTAENDGNKDTIDNLPEDENTGVSDEVETQEAELTNEPELKSENANETENLQESATTDTDSQVTSNGDAQKDSEQPMESSENSTKPEENEDDKVGDLKSNSSGRSTPSRMSTRLANVTPSTIRTRRASRLAQNQ